MIEQPGSKQPTIKLIPRFFVPLGFDFIIKDNGRVVLIELQFPFGTAGMQKLVSEMKNHFLPGYWPLRLTRKMNPEIGRTIHDIAWNKYKTYKLFKDIQPETILIGKEPLENIRSDIVLVKPLCLSRGREVLPLLKESFLNQAHKLNGKIAQEFVKSAEIVPGRIGCLRHILGIYSSGFELNVLHIPPYWRIAPAEFVGSPNVDSIVANLYKGADCHPVEEPHLETIEKTSNTICKRLLLAVANLNEDISSSVMVPDNGTKSEWYWKYTKQIHGGIV